MFNKYLRFAKVLNIDVHRLIYYCSFNEYSVYQVASAGMKDGSVTLPLGSVDVEEGTRIRFYVRDGEAAKDEIAAILKG